MVSAFRRYKNTPPCWLFDIVRDETFFLEDLFSKEEKNVHFCSGEKMKRERKKEKGKKNEGQAFFIF